MKRFDYCTIIGRDPNLYRWHINNVIRNAGLSRSLWDFHTIVYRNKGIPQTITTEIERIAVLNDIRIHFYDEIECENFENDGKYETFLKNLYSCWNLVQMVGETPISVRAGSDQAFGPNAFLNMLEAWDKYQEKAHNENVVMFHNLIECKSNVQISRHILEDFGKDYRSFDEDAFKAWCHIREVDSLCDFEEANKLWGAPRNINMFPWALANGRADGASWIQTKEMFKKFGPMPVRYSNGLTGDQGIMENMRKSGVKFYIIGNSTTYHLSKGESGAYVK